MLGLCPSLSAHRADSTVVHVSAFTVVNISSIFSFVYLYDYAASCDGSSAGVHVLCAPDVSILESGDI